MEPTQQQLYADQQRAPAPNAQNAAPVPHQQPPPQQPPPQQPPPQHQQMPPPQPGMQPMPQQPVHQVIVQVVL